MAFEMAAARARRSAQPAPKGPVPATRPAVRAVRGPAVRPSAATGVPGRGIRWDRVGRMALLVVLVGIVALYIGPLQSYWSTRSQAAVKQQDVQRLERENARLKERRVALRSKGVLEQEARKRGMVMKGERPFVVRGLPKGP